METATLADEVDMDAIQTEPLEIRKADPPPILEEDNSFYWITFAVYTLPVLFYSWYAVRGASGVCSWPIVAFGLLLACFGTVAMILTLRQREFQLSGGRVRLNGFSSMSIDDAPLGESLQKLLNQQNPIEDTELRHALAEAQAHLTSLQEMVAERDYEIEHLREENALLSNSSHDLDSRIKNTQELTVKKDSQLSEYQQTILEQKNIIDKKQQYIWKLESKVQDLKYEVETLLQLKDLGAQNLIQEDVQNKRTHHPVLEVFDKENTFTEELEPLMQPAALSSDKCVQTHYDAAQLLRRCIETAQKLTGANHFSGAGSRLIHFSADNYAIDLRRLFDSFRTETSCLILFYSEKEQRLLFVNNYVKSLLGWSPEKFIKDFSSLIHEGADDWKEAVAHLETRGESQVRLLVKSRAGRDVLLHCTIGIIPSGNFKGHVVAVCHPS